MAKAPNKKTTAKAATHARSSKRPGHNKSGAKPAVATASTAGKRAKRTTSPRSVAQQLAEQLRAVRHIGAALASSVGLEALFERIVPQVTLLMHAERTTLFLHDESVDEIWSKVAEGEGMREIRLSLGQGIAGWVARHLQTVNISDAYRDARFNPEVDARTGFRTQSVAAVPLVDRHNRLLGVLQVLNHQTGAFSPEDIGLLEAIAAQTAYAVENAKLSQHVLDQNRELDAARQRAERRRAELDLLYQLEQETSASANLDELLDSIIVRACERLRSAAGSVFLLDKDTHKLYFRGVLGPKKDELKRITLDPNEGVVGWVAKHGEPLIVNRPEDDPRHIKALAEKIDYPARALLAVPLIWDAQVIGAVEVLNPCARSTGAVGYDLEDLKVLTVIAGQVARAVALTLERQARLDTERLAAVGRMLAGVAHDLRNPMTVISGYTQLMAAEDDANERQGRCERVLHQVDEMTGMIQDLLAFARGDSRLRLADVDVANLAAEVRDNVHMQCDPRGITLEVAGTKGCVRVDPGRTKRIVYNLARNAVEVLGRGDKLSIELGVDSNELTVRVADSGPGIPEELAARIFDPFVTSGKHGATGLGLSIVKRFVDDHGGSIEVKSESGAGTAFFVRLPHAEQAAVAREGVS